MRPPARPTLNIKLVLFCLALVSGCGGGGGSDGGGGGGGQPAPPAGSLDTSFHGGGKLTTAMGTGDDMGNAVAIQADGKIVVAGTAINAANDFALARYNADGSLDTSFGTEGKVMTYIGAGDDEATAVAIDADGKIVVAGRSFNGTDWDFALARFNTNGSLDTSFGTNGKVTTAIGSGDDEIRAIAIQAQTGYPNTIVVAGISHNGTDYDFALARYDWNGNLVTSFDGDGKVTTAIGLGNDWANAVAIQPDGKIVVAGYAERSGFVFALVRYHPDGSLDTAFDGDGKVALAYPGSGWALAIQADGKILVAGRSAGNFALMRYSATGALDTTFDADGMVSTSIGIGDASLSSLAIQADGKIMVAGYSNNGTNYDFALARYNANGSLDTSFGTDGKVITAIGSGGEKANALAIQADGRIVVAGFSYNGTDNDFALVRYWP